MNLFVEPTIVGVDIYKDLNVLAATQYKSDFTDEPNRKFVLNLKIMLQNARLKVIDIPTSIYENEDIDDATGDYMNFLQMHGLIFLPVFNRKEDDHVIKQFEELFPDSIIIPVLSNDLSKEGGIINCVTWNIKK